MIKWLINSVFIIQVSIVSFFIYAWEMASRLEFIDPFYFSSPIRILENIYTWINSGILFKHLWITLSEAAVGLIVGMLFGLIFGFIFAANRRIDQIFQPFIGILNALPRIAFAPLIILWFGFGFLSKVVMVVSLVFFVVFMNTYQGFKEVNPLLLKNIKVLGASKFQIIRHVYIPAAITWIFTSLRLSVGYSVIAAIIGEYIGSSAGIGYLIDNAQSMFDSTGVMTGLTVLTIAVGIIDYFIRFIENRYARWK